MGMERDCQDRRGREDESGQGSCLPANIEEFLRKQPLVRFVERSFPLKGADSKAEA